MDGSHAAASFAVPDWLSRALEGSPLSLRHAAPPPPEATDAETERRAARAPAFLRRDLSEEALRPPVEPSFGEADLCAAEQRGYERGHAAGLAEAEASQAAFAAMTLAAIAGEMTSARAAAAAVADEAAAALARAVLAAMQAVMPALIAATALDEIDAMLGCVLPGLAREPEIRVTVAPDLSDAVSTRLDRLSRADRDRILVVPGVGLAPGAARIAWSAGHAERNPGEVWRQVTQALLLPAGDTATQEIRHGR
jgi:flagellar biosynthesis/type III secretory pathway protein FliH